MFAVFLQGLIMGITLCLMIGPVFFQLIQISMERGYLHAIFFASGVWLSDFLLMAMAVYGVSSVTVMLNNPSFVQYQNAVVGGLFVVFGGAALLRHHATIKNTKPILFKSDISLFFSGFVVNSINPFTVVFWITLAANFNFVQDDGLMKSVLYFGTILAITVGTDIGKAKLARLLTRILKDRHLQLLQIATGLTLIAFGLAIIARIVS
jgi:threonine/homoserine/homoserine lactone efflux protein